MARRRVHDFDLAPITGDDTAAVLEEAIQSLGTLRGPGLGDAGFELQILTSLIAQANRQLPGAVADARDQDYSWSEIGELLGVTRATAWQRYAGRTATNRTPVSD